MSEQETTVRETEAYKITVRNVGETPLYDLRGRFTKDILPAVRDLIDDERGDVAIRTEELSGVGAALARELIYLAKQIQQRRGSSLILIKPDANLKNYVQIIYEDKTIKILQSEEDLARGTSVGAVAEETNREISKIERELNGNFAWQARDREGNWLCPFCAEIQPRIRIPSLGTFTPGIAEKVYRHVHDECAAVKGGQTVPRRAIELQEVIEKIDTEKERLTATRVTELEEKAGRQEVLEKQYEAVRKRQRSLLPAAEPQLAGFSVATFYEPGETLSGDFFDFVALPDQRMAFIIGDATGKGISGSILMAVAKKVLQIRIREKSSPVEALKQVNRDLAAELAGASFASAFVGVLDPKKRVLRYSRAGHFPPILIRRNKQPRVRFLDARGMPLGAGAAVIFEQLLSDEEVTLESGDVLALYTDGVKEARGPSGPKAFEVERIVETLEDHIDEAASSMAGAIHAALDAFAGPHRADDSTLIVIKVE